MSIDPKLAMYLNLAYLVLSTLAAGTLSLAGIVSPAVATQVMAISGLGAGIINVVLHAYSSASPGPAVK